MNGVKNNITGQKDCNIINESDFIKGLFKETIEKLEKIKSDSEIENKENGIYEKDVKNILSSMEEISNFLHDNSLFKDEEYYDFLTIFEISEFILNEKELFLMNYSLIGEPLIKFRKILLLKLEYWLKTKISDNDIENYEKAYARFKMFLFEKEEFFFLNISPYTGEDENLIIRVSNITSGDYN